MLDYARVLELVGLGAVVFVSGLGLVMTVLFVIVGIKVMLRDIEGLKVVDVPALTPVKPDVPLDAVNAQGNTETEQAALDQWEREVVETVKAEQQAMAREEARQKFFHEETYPCVVPNSKIGKA